MAWAHHSRTEWAAPVRPRSRRHRIVHRELCGQIEVEISFTMEWHHCQTIASLLNRRLDGDDLVRAENQRAELFVEWQDNRRVVETTLRDLLGADLFDALRQTTVCVLPPSIRITASRAKDGLVLFSYPSLVPNLRTILLGHELIHICLHPLRQSGAIDNFAEEVIAMLIAENELGKRLSGIPYFQLYLEEKMPPFHARAQQVARSMTAQWQAYLGSRHIAIADFAQDIPKVPIGLRTGHLRDFLLAAQSDSPVCS